MALLPTPTSDYTDKDFDSIRFRLRSLIRSVFPEWTDFNVANFGNLLVELFAHSADVLTTYQDNQSRQSRIVTATQRKALLGLVKLVGFVPASATPATADIVVALPTVPVGSVTIPAGTFVFSQEVTEPIKYQLLTNAFIEAGANPPQVTVASENSETKEDVFSSNGLANQTFVLTSTPYIDNSVAFLAGDGAYTQVADFLSSGPTDKHFTVVVDQNDRATIRTGNGVNGTVPVGNVTIEYKIGGGAAGRVEANKLTRLDGVWKDSLNNLVQPTVTNPEKSSGGTDRQTVAQIKERAPATVRVQNRTVSREDYEINALRLPDVARALMLTSNEDVSIQENEGTLYIIPTDGGLPSIALKDLVLNQVTVVYPNTLTFKVLVQDPSYKSVDVRAVVYIRAGSSKTTVKAAILSGLRDFFRVLNTDGTKNENIDFGANIKDSEGEVISELALSDIFNLVRDVTGVRKVGALDSDFTLNGDHADVLLERREFPQLGDVELIDGDTGNPL